jgi:hypothetical protein
MTDSGGRIVYDPTIKRRIKKELKIEVVPSKRGAGGSGAGGGAIKDAKTKGVKTAVVPAGISVQQTVWLTLNSDGTLPKALSEFGIVGYLQLLAEFVERAADGGLEGVQKRFDVKAESGLLRLQTLIRKEVGAQVAEQFKGAAERSFHIGSINWAKGLLNVSDPMKVKIGKLVEVVARNPDKALIQSPTFILKEYGKRLLESAIPGGEATRPVVERTVRSFGQQFDAFMKKHNNADEWRSDTLAATVKEFEKLLLE